MQTLVIELSMQKAEICSGISCILTILLSV
jgi:hypothetical protein